MRAGMEKVMFKRINEPLLKNGEVLFAVGDTCNEIIGEASNWERSITSVWDLKEGDDYYYIDTEGTVICTVWVDDHFDRARRINGIVYLTREEAEEVSWKSKFETKMRKVFKPELCNWEVLEQAKCCLYYNYFEEELKVNARVTSKTQGTIYCTDVEVINHFLENNRRDLLRYFEVKQ